MYSLPAEYKDPVMGPKDTIDDGSLVLVPWIKPSSTWIVT